MTGRPLLGTVRSGGQTGVDIAALRAAKALGVATAGTMPLGFRTHGGPRPEYAALYGCTEAPSPDWAPRTRANVAAADATLRLALDMNSPGERCTANACRDLGKPCVSVAMDLGWHGQLVPEPGEVDNAVAALRLLAVRLGRPLHLNVAGNSERTAPGIEAAAERVLRAMLARIAAPLKVYTGRLDCGDRDRLDISHGGLWRAKNAGRPFPGAPWAPSREILAPALQAREVATKARLAGRVEEAELVEASAWEVYVPAYEAEMRQSYRIHRGAWDRLLARERVVGVCFCAEKGYGTLRCHRRLLAAILAKCGAEDMGELPRAASRGSGQTGLPFSGRAGR